MGTTPTTTNSTATAVNTAVNDVVQAAETIAANAAIAALDAAEPVFALPVIKQITDVTIKEAISYLGNDISIGMQTVGTFLVIDTQGSSEEGGSSTALANLMIAEKGGDPSAIQAAIQAYANYQSSLVHSDGSAAPSV